MLPRFLRSSEFTIPTQSSYDPEVHLSVKDVAVDNKAKPRMLKVNIKQSKTDPFRQGVTLCLGKTDLQLCPVDALLPYLVVRGNREGPQFILGDGRRLTRDLFSNSLDNTLASLCINSGEYNTHSFRIGAATSASEAGIPDSTIRQMAEQCLSTLHQDSTGKASSAVSNTGNWRICQPEINIRKKPIDTYNYMYVFLTIACNHLKFLGYQQH